MVRGIHQNANLYDVEGAWLKLKTQVSSQIYLLYTPACGSQDWFGLPNSSVQVFFISVRSASFSLIVFLLFFLLVGYVFAAFDVKS